MLPRERLELIKEIATKEKKVYVSKLSKKFKMTEETIRRDLDKLEKQGILTRSYGGAILNGEKINRDIPLYNKLEKNIESIKHIAKRAVDFIKEGSTIVADNSSTTLEVLKLIKNKDDVTVITNSIEVLQELSQSNLNIISTGGNVNAKVQSLQGRMTQDVIKNYNVDIALVNCNGIDINKGIMDSNETEAEIKRIMIRQAKKVVLLADKTRIGINSLIKLFDYEDIDYIVTDIEPREEWMKLFELYNIEIIY